MKFLKHVKTKKINDRVTISTGELSAVEIEVSQKGFTIIDVGPVQLKTIAKCNVETDSPVDEIGHALSKNRLELKAAFKYIDNVTKLQCNAESAFKEMMNSAMDKINTSISNIAPVLIKMNPDYDSDQIVEELEVIVLRTLGGNKVFYHLLDIKSVIKNKVLEIMLS